jgi:hypothetical protein
VLASALGAATLTAAAPAMADPYHGYRRGGGDTTGAAIAGGVIGLALGAAIASGNRGDYYDSGYYYDGPRYPRYHSYYVYREYPRYYPRYVYRDDWRRHEWREHHWDRRGW